MPRAFGSVTQISSPPASTAGLLSTAGLANVAYVSKEGTDATGALNNIGKPYLTIAAAITAALAAIAAGATPYTIQLGAGAWTGNLTWGQQLSLRGLGSRISIVSGTLTLTAGATAAANDLDFSDVQITGACTFNFAAKSAGTSKLNFYDCIIGGNTAVTPRGGADILEIYGCSFTNTLTSLMPFFKAFGSYFGALTLTDSGGGMLAYVNGCQPDVVTLNGGSTTFSFVGCRINGSFTYSDGFGGTLSTAGCNFTGATITWTSGAWTQTGCQFANSGYLASAAPGTVNLTYWGCVVNVTAAATLTLPATARKGFTITVKNGNSVASGNNVTVGRNANSIDGVASDYTLLPLEAATFIGDGTNWWVT